MKKLRKTIFLNLDLHTAPSSSFQYNITDVPFQPSELIIRSIQFLDDNTLTPVMTSLSTDMCTENPIAVFSPVTVDKTPLNIKLPFTRMPNGSYNFYFTNSSGALVTLDGYLSLQLEFISNE